jgi:hypothetical protein
VSQAAAAQKRCSRCRRTIEDCACCDDRECDAKAICYECLRLAVGQAVAHPHAHGG